MSLSQTPLLKVNSQQAEAPVPEVLPRRQLLP